ncbi:methyltransferase domain-containing protein [Anabaena cylindrica FACHB-243]|uniref:Methyltransferase type 11 n=1 Tax=Anabaena cylindrica (strain ATCC 27899 / PCC 7122) TaxID=272123 RepID=K9ZDY7_ANACC|nr:MULTISPECIES: class I SAM-dependent methyltransferase [Anabaena]AFZ56954.1 Methyltransferase type 11 [Anabaena cylindrica PCC 7122]MBD2418864.1 methyltransferase domain-containing protein [Anabaena cylindrica FACHB-243]MBY5285766.1 methyltransferase domain-containing protein [Anabaena sp. CCAP 1446/1C]MBY5308755.1 methyltransferase domain-containing protein [Anabaena sp. CCAP 1446/1C]MCM2405144.1 class I SAM-dependent methyltransferase [Anabaena sp. CCAP 1446/1C]
MQINKLPFFFKSHELPDNGGMPEVLPFNLYFDEELKMFRQQATESLSKILREVYLKGSLAEGSISSESGKIYVEKIINYIFSHFKFNQTSSVLEVGFGSGIILRELKKKGISDLTGIEPGNHSRVEGLEEIELIKGFFPSSRIKRRFDLIFSFGILEHIEDPLDFIGEQSNYLNENGKIIFSVPNCEACLIKGDISIFIHEHYSYFTRESITQLIEKAGLFLEDISLIEGAFIATATKINSNSTKNFIYEQILPNDLFKQINLHILRLKQLFAQYQSFELAIYTPIRAINSLYLTGYNNFRLIDDNSELYDKYLPTLSKPVESFQDILSNPPECILIFSRTFGERIKQKCLNEKSLINTLIITLNDLERHN